MQNVASTSEDLKAISSKINQGTGTMGALVNDKSVLSAHQCGSSRHAGRYGGAQTQFPLRGFFNRRDTKIRRSDQA